MFIKDRLRPSVRRLGVDAVVTDPCATILSLEIADPMRTTMYNNCRLAHGSPLPPWVVPIGRAGAGWTDTLGGTGFYDVGIEPPVDVARLYGWEKGPEGQWVQTAPAIIAPQPTYAAPVLLSYFGQPPPITTTVVTPQGTFVQGQLPAGAQPLSAVSLLPTVASASTLWNQLMHYPSWALGAGVLFAIGLLMLLVSRPARRR